VNILDIVVIIIMAYCIIRGLMLGLLNSISSFVAIVAGVILAKRYYIVVSDFLRKITLPDLHGVLSYLLVFILFFIAIKLIFFLAKKIFSSTGLTTFDRILGVSLGFLKGILISGILITIVQVSMPPKSNIIIKSVLLPYYNKAMQTTGLVPKDFIKYYKNIREYY
jgi:membrane protein required for colicin V production